MGGILNDYLVELITAASEWLDGFFNEYFVSIVLYPENTMNQILGTDGSMITSMVTVCLNVGLSMIVFVFVKKGFETYVLWTDGDPDADPINLVVNFIKAMVTAVTFRFFYRIFADIIEKFGSNLLSSILVGNVSGSHFESGSWINSTVSSATGITTILLLIWVIVCFLLYFQFIMRGVELLILRLGFPIACLGIINADKGVFSPYFSKIVQLMLAVPVQVVLMKLSLALVLQGNPLWGVATVFAGLKIPAILSEFLYAGGGGGGLGSKMMAANQTVHLIKSLRFK
ncbi:MAG: DUF6102 family protein [Clostridiales Family XIII bacterium]|jgi:hypothetical protein|nr:DUF6102 family protein [Clostridiales Family XIII bacterium]